MELVRGGMEDLLSGKLLRAAAASTTNILPRSLVLKYRVSLGTIADRYRAPCYE
jgi:hypothetical protein